MKSIFPYDKIRSKGFFDKAFFGTSLVRLYNRRKKALEPIGKTVMADKDIFEKLNDKQKEAVLSTEGYVRVIAGAGSGKTKLLVSRYAYLVKDYFIDSANILCVTFTNKAAGEMRSRIRRLIGDEYDTTLICTYHGFCNRLLRENPEKLFLNKQFQIIDGYQQKAVLSEIYQKYELKLDYASFESILHKLGAFKCNTDYVPRICDPEPCQIMDEIKTQDDVILEEFMQRQKATYSLDFNDLISFAIYVLENNKDVREKWQERLNYIMVDEFQDSSKTESYLIDILSAKYRNVLIVGDPDQNIYEWRGSDVKLLVDFDKDHEKTQTIILNQNYRSTPEILKCANTLIEKNKLRLEKDLFTQNKSGPEVIHYHSKNDFEEMDHVIDNIKKIMKTEGYKYSDFAILYRSGFLSRIAEKKLVEKNIPYEIYGGVRFYQRMEILDILAYLKLIAFDDDTSFRRIINTPKRRFGRVKIALLDELKGAPIRPGEQFSFDDMSYIQEADEAGFEGSLYTTLKRNLDRSEFKNSDAAGFVSFIDSMRARSKNMRISEIVNDVTMLSGYESYIRELGDEERLDNLAEFKRIANEFEREFGEDLSLEEFLQQIALQSGEGNESTQDTVKLMTIHAAKGLEFPAVFILGFTEGVFPSSKTIEERKKLGLEEERRLCYVAITRAEKHLFLMDSEGVSPKGIKKLVSRFLDEIGTDNYKRIGNISDELMQESRSYANRLNREIKAAAPPEKHVGDHVEHHAFGPGVIMAIDDKRGSYIVEFDKLAQPRNISKAYFDKTNAEERLSLEESAPEETALPSVIEAPVYEESWEDEGFEDEKEADNGEWEEDDDKDDGFSIEETDFDDDEDDYSSIIRNEDDIDRIQVEEIRKAEYRRWEEEETEEEQDFGVIEMKEPEEDEANDPELEEAIMKAKELAKNSPNLWKRDNVPHSGWTCVGVEDLGAPVGICEMCGYQIIRYAHHMEHPMYRSLICGCVCAGKMEGSIEEAKKREADFKKMQSRRIGFFKRKWKKSKKGNEYLKIEDHIVVIYNFKNKSRWKYSIDAEFSEGTYTTRERAMAAAFDRLEELKRK